MTAPQVYINSVIISTIFFVCYYSNLAHRNQSRDIKLDGGFRKVGDNNSGPPSNTCFRRINSNVITHLGNVQSNPFRLP